MAKFMGIPYPIRKNPQGFFYKESGVNQIKADLLQLLLTNPGERVMNPQFGTPLRSLLFNPNTVSLQKAAKDMIVNSIRKWEPRIAIEQIEVSTIDEDSLNSSDDKSTLEQILFIRIIFVDPENITEIQELKLEVPLAG